MKTDRKPEERLNRDLCPEEFRICVPRTCRLLGYRWDRELSYWDQPKGCDPRKKARDKDREEWERYLRTLTPDHELPPEYQQLKCKPPSCWTGECKPGYELEGDLAVAHACRVHDRIHRQLLAFEHVSAVDVGFAIWERQTRFGNFLAIRIHVNRKLPPEQLARVGLANFTQEVFVLSQANDPLPEIFPDYAEAMEWVGHDNPYGATTCHDYCRPDTCPHPDRTRKVLEILKHELKTNERLLRELGRYPISGVRLEDLSIFCPPRQQESIDWSSGEESKQQHPGCEEHEPQTLEDLRLCICGVPIDIVNAQYSPSTFHPGGDANSGVFAEPAQRGNQLQDDELRLIGSGRANPLVGGVSIGSVTGQAGTLGAIVWDQTDGTPCILSNWHVLAGTATAQIDQPTYQPALFDGGTEDDAVAHLKRWHLGEKGDAALAELAGNRHFATGETLGLWHPISGMIQPRLNLGIRKWGRTTGFTQGFVDGINLATNIDYGGGVVRYFRNQFHIAPLYAGEDVSQVGDSGSLVVTSLKPFEMEEDLNVLTDWLQDACDTKETLRRDIKSDLGHLIESCKQNTLQPQNGRAPGKECAKNHCKNICKHLKKLKQKGFPRCNQDPIALCKEIKQEWKALQFECSGIYNRLYPKLKFYSYLREGLQPLHERCMKRPIKYEVARKRVNNFVNLYNEPLPPKIYKIIKECEKESQESGCEFIACVLQRINLEIDSISHCFRICRCADQAFRRWFHRCKSIRRNRICQILEAKCQSHGCSDPEDIIDCIQHYSTDSNNTASSHTKTQPLYNTQGNLTSRIPDDITELIESFLEDYADEAKTFLKDLRATARRYRHRKKNEADRNVERVYYAVGMIFAGDTPGSPFGEFAVASDIESLAEELRFSLRPVFEPRSSFRELRERPPTRGRTGRALRSGRSLTPGVQRGDLRAGGPQPDLESIEPGTGDG